jgi:hypothetical protein
MWDSLANEVVFDLNVLNATLLLAILPDHPASNKPLVEQCVFKSTQVKARTFGSPETSRQRRGTALKGHARKHTTNAIRCKQGNNI